MQITKEEVQEWLKENKITRAFMAFLAKEAFGYRAAIASGALLTKTEKLDEIGQLYTSLILRAQLYDQLQDEESLLEVLIDEDSTRGAQAPD